MKQKFLVLISIILTAAVLFSLWWNQAIKPADPTDKIPVTFTVKKGESARSISERLKNQGFIRSSLAFFIRARFTGLGNDIQAGQFILTPSMDMDTIATTLTHGTIDVRVTIPEGWRNEEIALKLTQGFGIPESEFLKVSSEGYMFPDTYFIPQDASAAAIAKLMLDNFNKKLSAFDENKIKKKGLTLKEIVAIASLVEREASHDEDRPLVASVILNRLKIGMKLDIDATIQYALGYQQKEKSWWKKELTLDDINIQSPYNTYRNAGLPPSPIANPGIEALEAVYNAPDTDYIYYISDATGKIHPAKTIEEHNTNISKYLNK